MRELTVGGRPVKGMLYDVDDLLVVVERDSKLAWITGIRIAAQILDHPEWADDGLAQFLLLFNGCTAARRKELCLERFGDQFPYEKILKGRTDALKSAMRTYGVTPKPGAVQICRWAQTQNLKQCVVTSSNGEEARLKLDGIGLLEMFGDMVVTSCDITGRGKPEPEPFLRGAEKLGLDPDQCIALEDSHTGILSAYRANTLPFMVPGMVPATDEDREMTEGRIFPSLYEVQQFLAENLASAILDEAVEATV